MKIIRANQTNKPKQIVNKAYKIFCNVYDNLPAVHPPLLFSREKSDFKVDNVVVAINDNNKVVGTAILEPAIGYKDVVSLFEDNALDILQKESNAIDLNSYYVVGSVAILPDKRLRGFGTEMIKAINDMTDNKCLAFVTTNNDISKKVFKKAGFDYNPSTILESKYSITGNDIVLDKNGDYSFDWNLFYSSTQLAKNAEAFEGSTQHLIR